MFGLSRRPIPRRTQDYRYFFGYSRRQLPGRFEVYRSRCEWPEGRTIWGLDWNEQMKLAPERRPHPAYLIWRDVHPCYYYRFWGCGTVQITKEAWVVKIERGSPRAMKPYPVSENGGD